MNTCTRYTVENKSVSRAPTKVSLMWLHTFHTLFILIANSPDEILVKKLGLRKNVLAIMATCISTTLLMRSVQRLRVSEKSIVPMPAPASSPKMGRRSRASPVGITMSNIILFAIGVNMPNRASTSAVANSSSALGTDMAFAAYFIRSAMVSSLFGNGMQNAKACRLSAEFMAFLFTFWILPSLSMNV